MVFAKLKTLFRQADERTIEASRRHGGASSMPSHQTHARTTFVLPHMLQHEPDSLVCATGDLVQWQRSLLDWRGFRFGARVDQR